MPLLALLASVQAVNRARDDGSLELFLSHPIGRGAYLGGVALVRFAALALPLALWLGDAPTRDALAALARRLRLRRRR